MDNKVTIKDSVQWSDYLLNGSEGSKRKVEFRLKGHLKDGRAYLDLPPIKLPCNHSLCKGTEYVHDTASSVEVFYTAGYVGQTVLQYKCRNCQNNKHMFAIFAQGIDVTPAPSQDTYNPFDDEEEDSAPKVIDHFVTKFGQIPAPGGPMPSVLLSINDGAAKELWRKGLEAQRHSLGIAAFIYYRHALEKIHVALLNEIKGIALTEKQKKVIDKAQLQNGLIRKFTMASRVLPESLKMGTDNPLLLINDCLNCGAHEGPTDEECLEVAHDLLASVSSLLLGIREIKRSNRNAAEVNASLRRFRDDQKKAKVLRQQPAPSLPSPVQALPQDVPELPTPPEGAR